MVWRNEVGVERNGKTAAIQEVVDWDFWNGDKGGRVLHSFGVHGRSENGYGFVVWCSKGFKTFITLHA